MLKIFVCHFLTKLHPFFTGEGENKKRFFLGLPSIFSIRLTGIAGPIECRTRWVPTSIVVKSHWTSALDWDLWEDTKQHTLTGLCSKWFLGYKNDSYGFDIYLQQKVYVGKNIFDESKLFSNATLIWAIKCKVEDFAQELVGTLPLSLSKAWSSPPHSLHHSNPTICNTRWYQVEIDHISCLNSCLRLHCMTHHKGSWGRG